MPEKQSKLGMELKWFTILLIVVGLIFTGVFLYVESVKNKDNSTKVNVTIDKTVIIQKVQKLSRLEAVSQTVQRDITVQIDAGALNFFNVPLLENTRTQKIAVTGVVTAGVDLTQLNQDSITNESGKLKIKLPAPQIFNVNILEDKTTILKDDLTLLFKFQDVLSDTRRRELNELLQQQVIKQTKKALAEGACKDNILITAGENSDSVIQDLLTSSGYSSVSASYTQPTSCGFVDVI